MAEHRGRGQGRRESPDRIIGELAARQHGVVARRQLLAAGLTDEMIRTRLANARLMALHRGVYAADHAPLRRESHWLAAVFTAGPCAVLSHRAAAGLHGLRPANGATVDVTTTAASAVRRRGIRIHRTRRVHPSDFTVARRIPVTSVARTLVDLAAVVPADHLAKAVAEAERLRVLDVRALRSAAERARHRRGSHHAALDAALARCQPISATRSSLEIRFLELVRHAGLPEPRVNAWIEGVEVDALWPAARLAVELDGWTFHRTKRAFQADREKDRHLKLAGYDVVRFTYDDVVRHTQDTVAALRALLAQRGPRAR